MGKIPPFARNSFSTVDEFLSFQGAHHSAVSASLCNCLSGSEGKWKMVPVGAVKIEECVPFHFQSDLLPNQCQQQWQSQGKSVIFQLWAPQNYCFFPSSPPPASPCSSRLAVLSLLFFLSFFPQSSGVRRRLAQRQEQQRGSRAKEGEGITTTTAS
jgi:hypothetical protein